MQTDRQTVVTIMSSGKLYLNTDEVTTKTLAQKLIPILDRNKDQVVIIKADKDVELQRAVEVIDVAKGVGAQRFMIATQPSDSNE